MTPKSYTAPRAKWPIILNGKLDDAQWLMAPWSDLFVDIEGDKKPMPRFETRMKMLWDDEFLYVGAQMEEPDLWATLTERDSVIFHDNDFEIFVDPDGDAARYFEVEVNQFGTIWDLYLETPYRDGGSADNSWQSGIEVAVHLDGSINDSSSKDRGWSLECRIPWAGFAANGGLPCPPKIGDSWRINFSRVEWQVDVVDGKYVKRPDTPEDNWVWSPQGVIDMHQPEMWGYVHFGD